MGTLSETDRHGGVLMIIKKYPQNDTGPILSILRQDVFYIHRYIDLKKRIGKVNSRSLDPTINTTIQ